MGEERIRSLSAAWHHLVGNVVVVLLSLWNWYRRYDLGERRRGAHGPLISLVVVLILLYTGWRGWKWSTNTGWACRTSRPDRRDIHELRLALRVEAPDQAPRVRSGRLLWSVGVAIWHGTYRGRRSR